MTARFFGTGEMDTLPADQVLVAIDRLSGRTISPRQGLETPRAREGADRRG